MTNAGTPTQMNVNAMISMQTMASVSSSSNDEALPSDPRRGTKRQMESLSSSSDDIQGGPSYSISGPKKIAGESSAYGNSKENVYKFKVQFKHIKKTYRIILLKGASSLQKLAEAITDAFDFDMDHAFAFYNNVDQSRSTQVYTLFADTGMKIEPREKSVASNYIYKVFQRSDKWLFYYDYGDTWEFLVECQDDNYKVKKGEGDTYPQVIKTVGIAPPQYVYD